MSPRPAHMPHRTGPERRSGFTTIEILAVVIIFGVLATVAMPKVQGIMRTSKLNAATAVVAGDLSHAYTLAARSRRPVRLTCDVSTAHYSIADRDAPGKAMTIRKPGTDRDMGVTGGSCSAATVDFFPNGVASGEFGVTLLSRGDSRLVSMSRAGKVRITKP